MIASLFKKSTPLNYAVVILAVVLCFSIYALKQLTAPETLFHNILKIADLGLLLASLFVANFVVKKNGLSKDSSYTILFYFMFILFFPELLVHSRLVFSNFFILLALRRLISLHSPKATKEKIFDASVWIFIATMFNFWCILFLLLVYISILFHGARDYRKWFLPLIAAITMASIFLLFALIFDKSWITHLINNAHYDVSLRYFERTSENIALSVYATVAVFFVVLLLLSISSRPLILHSSYKKLLWAFFIGTAVYLTSPAKSNGLLIFTFAPLAMMVTSFVEFTPVKWHRDAVVASLITAGCTLFLIQL